MKSIGDKQQPLFTQIFKTTSAIANAHKQVPFGAVPRNSGKTWSVQWCGVSLTNDGVHQTIVVGGYTLHLLEQDVPFPIGYGEEQFHTSVGEVVSADVHSRNFIRFIVNNNGLIRESIRLSFSQEYQKKAECDAERRFDKSKLLHCFGLSR